MNITDLCRVRIRNILFVILACVGVPFSAVYGAVSVSDSQDTFMRLLNKTRFGEKSEKNAFFPDAVPEQQMQPGKVYDYTSADKTVNASAVKIVGRMGDDDWAGLCSFMSVLRIYSSTDRAKLDKTTRELKVEGPLSMTEYGKVFRRDDLKQVKLYDIKSRQYVNARNAKKVFYYRLALTNRAVVQYVSKVQMLSEEQNRRLSEDERVQSRMTDAHESRHYEDLTRSGWEMLGVGMEVVENFNSWSDKSAYQKEIDEVVAKLEENYARIYMALEARAEDAKTEALTDNLMNDVLPWLKANLTTDAAQEKKGGIPYFKGKNVPAGIYYTMEDRRVPAFFSMHSQTPNKGSAGKPVFGAVKASEYFVSPDGLPFRAGPAGSLTAMLAARMPKMGDGRDYQLALDNNLPPRSIVKALAAESNKLVYTNPIRVSPWSSSSEIAGKEMKLGNISFVPRLQSGSLALCTYAQAHDYYYPAADQATVNTLSSEKDLSKLAKERQQELEKLLSMQHSSRFFDDQARGDDVNMTSSDGSYESKPACRLALLQEITALCLDEKTVKEAYAAESYRDCNDLFGRMNSMVVLDKKETAQKYGSDEKYYSAVCDAMIKFYNAAAHLVLNDYYGAGFVYIPASQWALPLDGAFGAVVNSMLRTDKLTDAQYDRVKELTAKAHHNPSGALFELVMMNGEKRPDPPSFLNMTEAEYVAAQKRYDGYLDREKEAKKRFREELKKFESSLTDAQTNDYLRRVGPMQVDVFYYGRYRDKYLHVKAGRFIAMAEIMRIVKSQINSGKLKTKFDGDERIRL